MYIWNSNLDEQKKKQQDQVMSIPIVLGNYSVWEVKFELTKSS